MSVIKELLHKAVEMDASDVHLKAGGDPYFRINGVLTPSGFDTLTAADLAVIVENILPAHLRERFAREHEADFSHVEDGVGRFRVNVFVTQGTTAVAMRYVKTHIPTFEELHLPVGLKKLAAVQRGIILSTGTTGCGKSTTMAAIIGEINNRFRRRIITIEDPVEYVFEDRLSIITQREVGLDTPSFESALKHVLRQDPDCIFIGEIRDQTSIRTALLAAETGHLVMTTLHASTSDGAIPRILDVFPAPEQPHIRMAIATNLHAVICQRLIPAVSGGVVPAVEIMFNTPTVRKLIEKNQLELLAAAIETGHDDGMQNFNQAIYELIANGMIKVEDGMAASTNPEALKMNLQGIFLDEGRRILST